MNLTENITDTLFLIITIGSLYSCSSNKNIVSSKVFRNDSLQVKIQTKLKNDTIKLQFYGSNQRVIASQNIVGAIIFDFGNNRSECALFQRLNDSVLLAIQNNWWNYQKSEIVYTSNGTKHTLKLIREIEEEDVLLAPWRKFW